MENEEVKTPQEQLYDDAMHYLGGFKLPPKEEAFIEEVDAQGNTVISLNPEFALRYKAFVKRQEQMEDELKAFKDYAYTYLTERNYTEPILSEGVGIITTKPYVRTSINSAELKSVLPNLFNMFSKETNVKGSVSIKVQEDKAYNPWDFMKNN